MTLQSGAVRQSVPPKPTPPTRGGVQGAGSVGNALVAHRICPNCRPLTSLRRKPKPIMQSKPHLSPKRRRKAPPSLMQQNVRAIRAALLDREADHELQRGFHAASERLSRQAAEMREAAR